MARLNIEKLVLHVLLCHGPLTDAELGWWIERVLRQNPDSAKKKRRALTKAGAIRFAGRVKITRAGRVQKKWELSPGVAGAVRSGRWPGR